MNIIVSGTFWSGSSAVVDLLKEFDNIKILRNEFKEFSDPGMVADHLGGLINLQNPSKIKEYIDSRISPLNKPFSLKVFIKRGIILSPFIYLLPHHYLEKRKQVMRQIVKNKRFRLLE